MIEDLRMYEHVFRKKQVGFCGEFYSGGLYLEYGTEWLWFTPGKVDAYSRDNYGLQEDE